MRRAVVVMAGLLFLAIPGRVHAQGEPDAAPVPAAENRAIRTLLDHRAEIGLTPDQVDRLQAIQAQVEERNRPLVARFLEIRRRWRQVRPANWLALPPARRRQIQAQFQSTIREETRGLGQQVQQNNREAMLEVRGLLTNAQKQRLRQFLGVTPAGTLPSSDAAEPAGQPRAK